MRFPSLILLTSFAASSLCSTVADVKKDINLISANITQYATVVKAFPTLANTGTALGYNRIHLAVETLGLALIKTTVDVKNLNTRISDADGADIVNALITLESPTCNSLNDLIARKASISALGAGGAPPRIANPHARRAAAVDTPLETTRKDLAQSKVLAGDLRAALEAALPTSELSRFRSFADRVLQCLNKAINAYAA